MTTPNVNFNASMDVITGRYNLPTMPDVITLNGPFNSNIFMPIFKSSIGPMPDVVTMGYDIPIKYKRYKTTGRA